MQNQNLPDYVSIKKIANALWENRNSNTGVAVMVGAGFTRSAGKYPQEQDKAPIWRDLCYELSSALYGSDHKKAPSDPLKLAEEYKANFGLLSLNTLLKSQIRNELLEPSKLHQDLLSFPWREILTTNWDTLLERAAQDVDFPVYETINFESEFTSSQSPRIVKLHGSIGTNEVFTLTQEDYRKYPETNAVFLNFARHVLIENDLCLLGFSGDDPNFIHWAGWVRDRLATKTRRIYLVTLELSQAKRKYLESINIIPIDLSNLVSDIDETDRKHQRAIELFFEILRQEKVKPEYEWEPIAYRDYNKQVWDSHENWSNVFKDSSYAASLLEPFIEVMQSERKTYPNWLVCPNKILRSIEHSLPTPINSDILSHLSVKLKHEFLYEMAWRYKILYKSLPDWLRDEFCLMLNDNLNRTLSKAQYVEICLVVLRESRLNRNEEEFNRWKIFANENSNYLENTSSEIAYEEALWAKNHLDYEFLNNIEKNIKGHDSIWIIRRASLLCELEKVEEAKSLLSDEYKKLNRAVQKQPDSVYLLSRFAWIDWMLKLLEWNWSSNNNWSNHFKRALTVPHDIIDSIRRDFLNRRVKFSNFELVEPAFEEGHYRQLSDPIDEPYFLANSVELNDFRILTDHVGIPIRTNHVDILSSAVHDLMCSGHFKRDWTYCILAIKSSSSDSSDQLKKAFTRVGITMLTSQERSNLLASLMKASQYWLKSPSENAISHFRILTEVLARLSISLSSQEANQVFSYGLDIAEEKISQHWWSFTPLDNLFKFSWEAVSNEERPELLEKILAFPIDKELSLTNTHEDWPNPIPDDLEKRPDLPSIKRRIEQLIDHIDDGSIPALLRIAPLVKKNLLLESESKVLADKLWKDINKLPNFKNVLPSFWLYLPSPDKTKMRKMLSKILFNTSGKMPFDPMIFDSIVSAAYAEQPLFPTNAQAKKIFQQLINWRPTEGDMDLLGIVQRREDRIGVSLAKALAISIIPSLDKQTLCDPSTLDSLLIFIEQTPFIEALPALPLFLNESNLTQIELKLREFFCSGNVRQTSMAANAIYNWRELYSKGKVKKYPRTMNSVLLFSVESRRAVGLSNTLWFLGEYLSQGWLSTNETERLALTLPSLYNHYSYDKYRMDRSMEISISLVRKEVVRLTKKLQKTRFDSNLELIIEQARLDPLPEVRYATENINS